MNHADTTVQPKPKKGFAAVTLEVVKDMLFRREQGMKKYGTELEAGNGRDALVDAYQESLDLTQYLKQTLMERDAKKEEPAPLFLNEVVVAYALHFVLAYRCSLSGNLHPRPLVHESFVNREVSVKELQQEYALLLQFMDKQRGSGK